MSTTIRETFQSALDAALEEAGLSGYSISSYNGIVESVTAALEEREYSAVEAVVEKAGDYYGEGYGEKAQELLAEAGLEARPKPEPVVEDEDEASESDADTARIDRLEAKINRLVEIAEKHLGATV